MPYRCMACAELESDGNGSTTINSGLFAPRSRNHRIALGAMVFAMTLALVITDFMTWIELDVATIFGLPLVLAAPTRSRRLLWLLTALLIATTFAVYAAQIAPGSFTLKEPYFVNRLLNAASLLLLGGLLDIWMRAAATNEAQARLIRDQNDKPATSAAEQAIAQSRSAGESASAGTSRGSDSCQPSW